MSFMRGLVTIVKVTSLSYKFLATSVLLTSLIITIKKKVRRRN